MDYIQLIPGNIDYYYAIKPISTIMKLLIHITIVFFAILFSTSTCYAQPQSFTVEGCTSIDVNGDYVRSATVLSEGCPCYDQIGGGFHLKISSFNNAQWWLYQGSCSTPGSPVGTRFHAPGNDCFIDRASPASVCAMSAITNVVFASEPIPTLSQWALIVLALFLMIVGALAIMRVSVRD